MNRPQRLRPVLAALGAFTALGLCASCAPPGDDGGTDLSPPRVVRVEPAGPIIPIDADFTITFSEDIATARLFDPDPDDDEPIRDFVVLVPAASVTDTWLTDVANPPLIDSRQDDIVPGTLEVIDSVTLKFSPEGVLARGTNYNLIVSADVRDTSGNPIVGADGEKQNFVYDLRTDAGPPQVTSTNAFATLPPNQKRFTVDFNQPVQNVDLSTVRFSASGGAAPPTIQSIEMNAARTRATVLVNTLGAGCERFTPSSSYELLVGPGIEDDSGRVMGQEPFEFSTGAACDLSPNVVFGRGVSWFARFLSTGETEVRITVYFSTTKPSTTAVRYGNRNEELDCLDRTCPALGDDARLVNDQGLYVHQVTFEDLVIDQSYDYAVFAEDDVGSVAVGGGSFVVTPTPTVAVNEILPNPVGDEASGEFIELVNYGDGPVSLREFGIIVGDKDECAFGTGAPTIQPDDFVVVAKQSFDPTLYPGFDELKLYTPETDDGDCGSGDLTLTNDIQAVQLTDDFGVSISAYAGYANIRPTDSHEGESIERINPTAPDENPSFCFGGGAPSPGRANSVLSVGCRE